LKHTTTKKSEKLQKLDEIMKAGTDFY